MDAVGICFIGMAVSAALVVWRLVTAELGGRERKEEGHV